MEGHIHNKERIQSVNAIIKIKKSLAALYLTVTHSKDKGQGHAYFESLN